MIFREQIGRRDLSICFLPPHLGLESWLVGEIMKDFLWFSTLHGWWRSNPVYLMRLLPLPPPVFSDHEDVIGGNDLF